MKVTEGRAEQIGGIVFVLFSLILALIIIPAQIKPVKAPWYNSPKLFPYVIAGLIFCFGAVLAVTGTRKARKSRREEPEAQESETYSITGQEARLVLITLGVVVIYVLAMGFLPYIPCTMVTLGLLMWIYGQRSWIKLIAVSAAFPLLIYFAFTFLLKLRLP